MVCPVLHSGPGFMSGALYAVDCQARVIGSYGYGALADPSSSVSVALTALVTIFIALFGIRLLLGPAPEPRDIVLDVLKIGLVLTIASAWPAWRTVVYDLVLNGPAEVARVIGIASGLPGSDAAVARLQRADDGIILLTSFGSGRLTGGVSAGTDIGDVATGVALSDSLAFGLARTAFLVSTIGSFAIVRLGAGILLAIGPLMAGLALFTWTMDVFVGWLRALAFCALGSLVLLVAQGATLALLFPWLNAVLEQRRANVLAVSAPTELLALMLAFSVLSLGALFLVARLAFFSGGRRTVVRASFRARQPEQRTSVSRPEPLVSLATQVSRADVIARSIGGSMQPVDRLIDQARRTEMRTSGSALAQSSSSSIMPPTLLGDSYRRNHRRASVAASKRNLPG